MSLLEECHANNRQSACFDRSRPSVWPVRQHCTANSKEIKLDGPWVGRLRFAEDFTMEHSLPGPHNASIEISGSF